MGPWGQMLRILRGAHQVGVKEGEFIQRMPEVSQDLIRILLGVGVRNRRLDLNNEYYSLSVHFQERGCSARQA